MFKLPKYKTVSLPNGQLKHEKTEADYLPVTARMAWFRKDNPYRSIITEVEQLGNKAVGESEKRKLSLASGLVAIQGHKERLM